MHVPLSCDVSDSASVSFTSEGDFEAAGQPPAHPLGDVAGATLTEIDPRARALLVKATQDVTSWLGVAQVPAAGDVDVLLLKSNASCALSPKIDQRSGAALVPIAGQRVIVVGGAPQAGAATPATFVARLDTGTVDAVDPGLSTRRQGASVTAFGAGALVAGGAGDDGMVLSSAEVYDPALGGFDPQRVDLTTARAQQGAVTLASGQTLLVGGVGADGKTLLGTVDRVDPVTRQASADGLATLQHPRRGPTVLRMASGAVLVAGGLDAAGAQVPELEWFAADGGSLPGVDPKPLPVGQGMAIVALQPGGALAVIAPPPGAPPDFKNVWLVHDSGVPEAATPIAGKLTAPVLFGGAHGEPVLWTGDRWLRWQPWSGQFGALAVVDDVPARVGDATASPDPGLALWIATDAPLLTALRFDTNDPTSALLGPLLVTDDAETAPDGLPGVGTASFDPAVGLVLRGGSRVFVTDRTYLDIHLDVDFPSGEPAQIVLRDGAGGEVDVGGGACPVVLDRPTSLHVERRGAVVTWAVAKVASGTCAASLPPDARVSVGVGVAPGMAQAVVRNLRVTRAGP
jgi:hypothetical protein